MESRKMVLTVLHSGQQRRHGHKNRLLDSVGEGEDRMIWRNSIETYTLPYVKCKTSMSLFEAGNQKLVLYDNLEGQGGEGGGGGTCIPMADSYWCMAKPTIL